MEHKRQYCSFGKISTSFLNRVHIILTEDKPVFDRYKAENDPEFEEWQQYSLPKLLDTIEEDRKTIYAKISNLTSVEIERVGIHKKYGALTIAQWTEFFLLHEAHHLFTVFQLAYDSQLLKMPDKRNYS